MRNANLRHKPELESDFQRNATLGYNQDDALSFIRCIKHGAPHPLIRWHYHKDCEIHLITSTKGKMFVGDYIGEFQPGNLVLIGPYLPHNWVSNDLPKCGVHSRDFSLHFANKAFRRSCELLPELNQVLSLLDHAKSGVEFFGISDFAKQQLIKIQEKKGIHSFNEFLILITALSKHSDYKLLSNNKSQNIIPASMSKFRKVVKHVSENYSDTFSMPEIAEIVNMESTYFSRSFKEASGYTFTEFVNYTRISRACELLSETDQYISTICYSIGYNTVANFNRRFVEIKKVTPSKYRKLCKYRSS